MPSFERFERDDPASEGRVEIHAARLRPVPIYEYVCMKCESHFEELVRNGETPSCPDCSSAKVQKQFSTFATHGAQSAPSFGQTAAGGGCCGGGCGCGH
jgi:putative FmdB family regulatory protein